MTAIEIEIICKKYKIENYTINDDMSIDVDGDVNLSFSGLVKIPLIFGNVTGYFLCIHNKLTTLEGSPTNVGGSFHCCHNKLTSLMGAPVTVGGSFYCTVNDLTSLEGSPNMVGGDFYCLWNANVITSLDGITVCIGGNFSADENLMKIHKIYNRTQSIKELLN